MKKLITLIMFFTAVVYSQTTDNEDVNDKDIEEVVIKGNVLYSCLLYTSPSPRDE